MFLPKICIERPVLATVMSLAWVALGAVGYSRLPVRELPDIEFPIVSVSTVLPGASPEVVEIEITELLEEELNGVEGLDLLQSISLEQVSNIRLSFNLDRDIDAAAQDVRDRVARVVGNLPEDAEEPRVAKYDVNAAPIMWIALHSQTRSPFEITELADSFLAPRLQTVPGVSRVIVGGSNELAIRIEIDRDRLGAYGLAVSDVVTALRQQNVEVPGGRVEGAWREFVVKTHGEFSTPEEFHRLIVKYDADSPVRLGDVAEIRLGFENERTTANFNGALTTGLGIVKQPSASTLTVANAVKALLPELERQLPDGYRIQVAFDQSPFIEESVREVWESLYLAGLLVVLMIFVFLQSVRATFIPSVAIPVSIIATFGILYFLGFTINNLVLMALTLVVGVVVDDAIIVLESAYRHMEQGKPRLEATRAATDEIAFAVVASTLTLVIVFVPIAFLGGTVGRFFYEFGISVVASILISMFVALTLTPMLCSQFLTLGTTASRRNVFGSLARRFDHAVSTASLRYERTLRWALVHRTGMLSILLVAVAASAVLFVVARKEFLPQDDRGYFMVNVETPEGSTLAYQRRYQQMVEQLLDATPEVRSYFSIVAIARGGPGRVNEGIMFVRLHPRNERERDVAQILADLRQRVTRVAGADVYFSQFNPLSQAGSNKPIGFVVQHPDFDTLAEHSLRLRDALKEIDGFVDVDTDLEINKPQLDVAIDRDKAASLGISVADIAETLKILLTGDAVTHYTRGNERHDVIVQLKPADRLRPRDASRIYLRTSDGTVVPLANLVQIRETVGPSTINHFERRRSVVLEANLVGLDLGHALEELEAKAAEVLPTGFSVSLSGESREYRRSARGLSFTLVLAVIAIYLVLAAQFESFLHPFTIMLALPLAALGALAALNALGLSLNVYAYIGIIMLMALVTKNSILLVDCINQLRSEGAELHDAICHAGRIRLRPILMTAVSTILGTLPIAIGLGAGAEGRRPLGVAVVAGMTTSTLLTLVVIPVVYSMLDDAVGFLRRRRAAARAHASGAVEGAARP